MTDFGEIRGRLKRRRETARILLDASLVSRHAELEAQLAAAIERDGRHGGDYGGRSESRRLALEVDALEAELADARDVFVFESIGATRWFALAAEHPPTKEQKASRHDRNPDTFLPAAVVASCVDPVMTADDVEWLRDSLTAGEWAKLVHACCMANEGSSDRPKSTLASAILRLNDPSPDTSESEALPDPLSSVANDEA